MPKLIRDVSNHLLFLRICLMNFLGETLSSPTLTAIFSWTVRGKPHERNLRPIRLKGTHFSHWLVSLHPVRQRSDILATDHRPELYSQSRLLTWIRPDPTSGHAESCDSLFWQINKCCFQMGPLWDSAAHKGVVYYVSCADD